MSTKANPFLKKAGKALPVLVKRRPCRVLSRLPKSPLPRGVTYNHRTPGSPLKIIASTANGRFIDNGHPAAKSLNASRGPTPPPFKLVRYASPTGSFSMAAGPNAILFEPETKWYPFLEFAYEKWEDRIARIKRKDTSPNPTSSITPGSKGKPGDEHEGPIMNGDTPSALAAVKRIVARRKSLLSKAVPMGLCFANNKAMMGGKAVYATRVRRRVRNAISIIVSHGARVMLTSDERVKGPHQFGYDLKEVESRRHFPGNKWILRDWTYVMFPTLELYRMPVPELVSEMRAALSSMYNQGMKMEKQWLDFSIHPGAPPLRELSGGSRRSEPPRYNPRQPATLKTSSRDARRISKSKVTQES